MKELIDKLDLDLMDRHRFDAELFANLTELQRESGLLQGDRAIAPFLRPYFLAESTYSKVRQAAKVLSSAFEKLTHFALENRQTLEHLGVSEKEARWAALEPGYKCVSVNSRLDTFLSPDGFSFLEYNGENPAGIGDQSSLEALFQRVPEVCRFLKSNRHYFPQPHRRLLEALDQTYREFGGKKEKPTIAIVDWAGVATGSEFGILQKHFESCGYPSKVCDPSELEFERGVLHHQGFPIDIFFKRVIIHEFLSRFDEQHPLFQALESGSVCIANSFRSKIPHKKSSFSILSDPAYRTLFSREELNVIDKCIPWTRKVRDGRTEHKGDSVELLEHIRLERQTLVLKPNDDYGGKGIAIGWESSEKEWDDAIQNALLNDYVVQERIMVEKTDIPMFQNGVLERQSMLVDFDPFLFRGEVEGGMVRLSDKALVNITQGGGETALAILTDF